MAEKRYLTEPSNEGKLKKRKFGFDFHVEGLKGCMQNASTATTVVLGKTAISVTSLGPMLDMLLRPLPSYDFIKEADVYAIVFREHFSEDNIKRLVDKLEINGAACVCFGDEIVRTQGVVLWSTALQLRGIYPFLKIPELELSLLERRVLHGQKEVETAGLLNSVFLSRRSPKHMSTQTLLKLKRILKKFNMYPNELYLEMAYHMLLKNCQETKEIRFIKTLFFIEISNEFLLKKKRLEQRTEEIMRLVLRHLPTVLQAPSGNFENIITCLSFCARFNLRTLKKGQEEGVAVEVLRSLLAKAVQLNANSPRTTKIMKKYLDRYKILIPDCHPSHYAFNVFQSMEREEIFQREGWMPELKKFLHWPQPVSDVKSLVCITASKVKSIDNINTDVLDLPSKLQQILNLH